MSRRQEHYFFEKVECPRCHKVVVVTIETTVTSEMVCLGCEQDGIERRELCPAE
jgi:hypothetical protein